MSLLDVDGGETVIRELEAGDQLGELPLLDGLPRSATALMLAESKTVAAAS